MEQVKDFDASKNGRTVFAKDKVTGEPVWQVPVMDADPAVKAGAKTVSVKIVSAVQPVPPASLPGLPFTPVEFAEMTVTAYVNQSSGRLAWSIRAREMRAPRTASAPASAPVKGSAGKDVAA
ncbi:plasmid replication, integration and excision activator [Rhizohabitans arisaemae]|uniref:plasmid replication, integration and excision activator n=1 Tax=Rhizohabitans arisaemae TaxID=2720610 RepID=UPI0024B0B239|nr:plasmid replication, integration and excision activator [Rhizohabitans arisaemae]